MPLSQRKTTAVADAELLKPTSADVVAAVKSLCVDQLKPMGRLVLKRIREQAAVAEAKARGVEEVNIDEIPLIDPKQLRKLCERCRELRVEPADGKEYAALLAGRNLLFVDPTNPVDQYPAQMWVDLQAHVMSVEGCPLPASRYDCSRVLKSRQLPFLQGYSLGALGHIVQLAISLKNILGYKDGQLVPYLASQQCAKEVCASNQQVFSKSGKIAKVVSSWEELRVNLQQLLNDEGGSVMLSAIKRLFKSRFDLDLSETFLGQRRMFELLQDPRMEDMCVLQGHPSGQLMVVAKPSQMHTCVQYVIPACMPQVAAPCSGAQLSIPALCLSTTPTSPTSGGLPPRTPQMQLPQLQLPGLRLDLAECASPGATPRRSLCSWSLESAWAQQAEEEEGEEQYVVCKPGDASECSDLASTNAESSMGSLFDELASVCTPVKNTFIDYSAPADEYLQLGSAKLRAQSEPRRMHLQAC